MAPSSKRDIPTPTDNGFTSAVFVQHQPSVSYGASLLIGHPRVSIFPALGEELPQRCRKARGQQATSRRGCARAISSQIPLRQRSDRSSWRLQTAQATAARL